MANYGEERIAIERLQYKAQILKALVELGADQHPLVSYKLFDKLSSSSNADGALEVLEGLEQDNYVQQVRQGGIHSYWLTPEGYKYAESLEIIV